MGKRKIRLVFLFSNLITFYFIFLINIIYFFVPLKTLVSSKISAQHMKVSTEPHKFTVSPY